MDKITLRGLLTSRIETKQDKINGEAYYYAFFKIPQQDQDIPVIFKGEKPTIPKGSELLLEGSWAQSNGSRPSFSVTGYQTLKEPGQAKPAIELNLYQKLQQVQSQTGKITKTEENKFGKYKYFTEQQALNILKPLLNEQNLTLTFSDVGELNQQKIEKDWTISYLKKAALTNSENPIEQLTFHFWAIGSNSDPAKAKGCAETYAIKYFLTKYFLIPTADELDPDVTKDTEHLNRKANAQKETPAKIQKRHEEKDRKREAELKAKYGLDWKLSQEYKLWRGNL